MFKEYLLVDGYNVIHDVEHLSNAAEASLDMARVLLGDTLCEYAALKGVRIILVFDAHLVIDGIGSIQDYRGIKIVYTKEAQTADQYIERAAYKLSKNAKHDRISVATSDSLEQLIILASGAFRITPQELWNDIQKAKEKMRKDYVRTRPIKKNPIENLVDSETAKKLEAMRLGDGYDRKRVNKSGKRRKQERP